MVRIRVPAVAAAVLALAACSSMGGAYPSPGGPKAVTDNAIFPPPPPLQAGAPAEHLAAN